MDNYLWVRITNEYRDKKYISEDSENLEVIKVYKNIWENSKNLDSKIVKELNKWLWDLV